MASLAVRVCPPILTIVALFGLTLAVGPAPQIRPEQPDHVVPWPGATAHEARLEAPPWQPPTFADARPWNQGGMVMGLPPTHDPIARNALTDLLSGLFDVVRSLRV